MKKEGKSALGRSAADVVPDGLALLDLLAGDVADDVVAPFAPLRVFAKIIYHKKAK